MKTSKPEPKPEPKPSSNHKTIKLLNSAFDLPSHDALARILPEAPQPVPSRREAGPQDPAGGTGAVQSQEGSVSPAHLSQTYQVHHMHKRPGLPDFKEEDNIGGRIDLEPKRYRSAMEKMAEDMVRLRARTATLEAENYRLHGDLSLHRDLGHQLLDDANIDVMTKAEIADRIANLKFTLASETRKASEYRDKGQQLQNELIRRNDDATEHARLQRAYRKQQQEVHRCQGRVAKVTALEATVKQQEKVIEKMEKLLDNKQTQRNRKIVDKKHAGKKHTEVDAGRAEMEGALATENAGLRRELERMRHQMSTTASVKQPAQKQEERLKVETSEARIRTLETQLKENCKLWGEEKQEMLTRLSETRHGFG